MWNKKEEAPAPRGATPQPTYTPPPAPPASVAPPPPPAPPVTRGATIGASMTVKGEVYSREELHVDGEILGSIEMQHRLSVGPSGKIKANVKAKEVDVQGSIQGNVESAEKIIIRDKGSLVGDIKTAGIVIEDGAYFKGSIDITKVEAVKKADPAPKAATPVPVPAPQPMVHATAKAS
jgi:cytoskeletal protein CcmA (bactofilin family)